MPTASAMAPLAAALAVRGDSWTALSACAIGTGTELDARAGLGCVDDSPECISRRQTTLRHLVDDKNRAWVKEPPTPEAYASGVRLFAFKTKKKELTCDELAHGKRSRRGASSALANAGSKLTHAQVTRGNDAGHRGRPRTSGAR